MRKTITMLCVVGVLLPAVSLAQTASMQTYIQSLYEQIKVLQARIAAMQTPAATVQPAAQSSVRSTCPTINRTLSLGSVNRSEYETDVSDLQRFLKEQGFYFGETYGMYDAATQLAVQEFQMEENVIAGGAPHTTGFGVVGPRTRMAIFNRCGGAATGIGACTREYMPVCALKQVQCITAPCNPVPTTYSNQCEAVRDNAQIISQGVCTSQSQCVSYQIPSCTNGRVVDQGYDSRGCKKQSICSYDDVNPAANPQCKAWFDGCNTCGRSTVGGPAFCTLRACPTVTTERPYCSGYFPNAPTTAPIIQGFTGPTTLATGQTGTWSIDITDPQNGQLSYYILWGDEAYTPSYAMSQATQAIPQTSSFTHSYANPGTYTVRITVRNALGSAEATASVVVGGGVQSNQLTATPSYGVAPLTVSFSGRSSPKGGSYTIDFGNGYTARAEQMVGICLVGAGGPCNGGPDLAASHTYTSSGTYTARLIRTGGSCATCMDYVQEELARTTVTVSGSGMNVCTADARQCPDGTWVGRTGVSCQFVCPSGVIY